MRSSASTLTISIPALRKESDRAEAELENAQHDFNPRSP